MATHEKVSLQSRFRFTILRTLVAAFVTGSAPLAWGTDSIDAEIAELRSRHSIPVVAYSIWRQGTPNRTRVLGAPADTPMRWGSITKTVTALTLLNMHQEGLIELDQPVAELVGEREWANGWGDTHPVTVQQLLELSAGFTDLSGVEFNYATPISLQGALALNPEYRITRWPPGLQQSYSNLTPGISQLVIERVSKSPFEHAVDKYLFTPLAMHSSNFVPRDDLPGGFKADGKTPIEYWHMTFPAYGALNAPLSDMQRLLDALMNSQNLHPVVRQRVLHPSTTLAARSGFDFEYASGLYPRIRRQHVWHSHGGDADGYRSRIAFMRHHKRGYIVAINTDNPKALRELEAIIERGLTQDLQPIAPPAPRFDPQQLQSWQGQYYPSSTRFAWSRWQQGQLPIVEVQATQSALTFTRNKRTRTLTPVSNNTFRRTGDPVATIAFVADLDGHQYIQGELGNFARIDGPQGCPSFMTQICEALSARR
jgi:CubicO group peptidase (beta-lactamase class C family)